MHDIDPNPDDIDDRAHFDWELTIVRARAGLTVRDVAKTVGIPAPTVGYYFARRALPTRAGSADRPHGAGPVPCAELDCAPGNPRRGQVEQVLVRSAAADLVTVDTESASITHDAVFAGWPRLADLVTAHRV